MQLSRIKRIQNATKQPLNRPRGNCVCCNVAPEYKREMIKSTRAAVKREFVESINRQLSEMQPDNDQFPLIEIPTPLVYDDFGGNDPEIPDEYRYRDTNNGAMTSAFVKAVMKGANDE